MKQLFIFILTTILVSTSYSQVISIPFDGKGLTTDQLGNYYIIKDTEIKKYDATGKPHYTYSNNVLGVIANVDVTNPYKVLVYFKEFTKILILDHTLSPSSDLIDLTTLELDETTLVCRSYNDGTWYYDPVRFGLIRKNQELVTTNTSGNMANILDINLQPNFLIEYNEKVYLNDPKKGILVFDVYGTYLKTIPIYNLTTFQIKDKYLIYTNKDNEIETYDFFTLETTKYKPFIYNSVNLIRVENKLIYIVNKKNQLFIDKIDY